MIYGVCVETPRFMVEVTKRFRDDVLLDTAFQKAATETLPNLIAAWKVNYIYPRFSGWMCGSCLRLVMESRTLSKKERKYPLQPPALCPTRWRLLFSFSVREVRAAGDGDLS